MYLMQGSERKLWRWGPMTALDVSLGWLRMREEAFGVEARGKPDMVAV